MISSVRTFLTSSNLDSISKQANIIYWQFSWDIWNYPITFLNKVIVLSKVYNVLFLFQTISASHLNSLTSYSENDYGSSDNLSLFKKLWMRVWWMILFPSSSSSRTTNLEDLLEKVEVMSWRGARFENLSFYIEEI